MSLLRSLYSWLELLLCLLYVTLLVLLLCSRYRRMRTEFIAIVCVTGIFGVLSVVSGAVREFCVDNGDWFYLTAMLTFGTACHGIAAVYTAANRFSALSSPALKETWSINIWPLLFLLQAVMGAAVTSTWLVDRDAIHVDDDRFVVASRLTTFVFHVTLATLLGLLIALMWRRLVTLNQMTSSDSRKAMVRKEYSLFIYTFVFGLTKIAHILLVLMLTLTRSFEWRAAENFLDIVETPVYDVSVFLPPLVFLVLNRGFRNTLVEGIRFRKILRKQSPALSVYQNMPITPQFYNVSTFDFRTFTPM